MRIGLLFGGILFVMLGLSGFAGLGLYFFYYAFGPFIIVAGIILIILGAVLPSPLKTAAVTPELHRWLEEWARRAYQAEIVQQEILRRMARVEEQIGLPPAKVTQPTPPIAEIPSQGPIVPVPTAAPPSAAPAPGPSPPLAVAVPAPAVPAPTPAQPVRPAPAGLSRLEVELGEKWFQRIGLIVLALAFFFLLAIVLPQLTPVQIVAIDFAGAIGLVLVGEFLFSRKGLQDYAKGLEAGAFALAYIGVWGGGFHFRLPGFSWEIILGGTLAFHAAASLRYRSPFLSIEVGLFYLAWLTWLRYIDVLEPFEYAALLSLGGILVLALVFAQRSELSASVLTFAFDATALGAFSLLAPWGFVPVLVIGLSTTVIITLFRLQKFVAVRAEYRVVVWFTGLVLVYAVLIANALPLRGRGGIDDLTIVTTFATLTAAVAASELLVREERFALGSAALVGLLSFPIPFLMGRGEIGNDIYPALLLALTFLRPVKGFAWLPNIVYVVLIAFAAASVRDPAPQFAAVWVLFFATAALHGYLQVRTGYGLESKLVPTDLQIILFAIALAALGGRAVPEVLSLLAYGAALPVAIVLNRRSLTGGPWLAASVVATVAVSITLGRWWAVRPLVEGVNVASAPYIAVYHYAILLVLAIWIGWWKPIVAALRPMIPWRVSPPALALLLGLLAQDSGSVALFVAVPLAVLALGFYLDDALSFNAGAIALAGQVALAVTAATLLESSGLQILVVFAMAFLGVAFALELLARRRFLARSAQLVGASLWFVVSPLAFGTLVETTLLWTAAGAAALGWGLWWRFATLRYLGFLLFFGVLGKVFLFDISGLALGFRIVGLIVVAASLLAISYGYAQYRKRATTEP